MRVKYLGTKLAVITLTVAATPVVWAALAWPQWSAASPADLIEAPVVEDVVPASAPREAAPEPEVIIRRVIVVPRLVQPDGSPVTTQTNPNQPKPAGPPASVPAAVPAATQPATTRPSTPADTTSAASGGGPVGAGGGGSTTSAGGGSSSTGGTTAGTTGGGGSTTNGGGSTTSGGGTTSGKTKGS
jgi:hypothetical protein